MGADGTKFLAQEFRADLEAQQAEDKRSDFNLPRPEVVATICRRYLQVLLPLYFPSGEGEVSGTSTSPYLAEIRTLLANQICSAVRFDCRRRGQLPPADLEHFAEDVHNISFGHFPELARLLASDIEAAYDNDPSASSGEEILLAYPYIEAVTVQRLAHRLHLLHVPFIPRMMTEIAHRHTGIDIHPGASLGESFFIDHGTGVVIGETSIIGNKVTLYHGVTLGAFNPVSKDETGQLRRGHENKRHPELEDHVTVYPNATILGGNTRIGHHSIIGGNVWLTHSVVPYSRVTLKEPDLLILNGVSAPYIGWGV
jgi:serine O-acetyltransferase